MPRRCDEEFKKPVRGPEKLPDDFSTQQIPFETWSEDEVNDEDLYVYRLKRSIG